MFAILACNLLALVVSTVVGKPNIVLILTDDVGYGEVNHDPNWGFALDPLSPGGGKPLDRSKNPAFRTLSTPNLVRLARQSIRAPLAFSGSSECAPSRTAILLGRHIGLSPIRGNAKDDTPVELVDNSTFVLGLQKAGYRTGCFGKWGLGQLLDGGPWNHGFEQFVGVDGSLVAFPEYVIRYNISNDRAVKTLRDLASNLRLWLKPNVKYEWNEQNCARNPKSTCVYVNDVLRDAVFAFIFNNTDPRPFFVLWTPTYAHSAAYNEADPPELQRSAVKRLSRYPPFHMSEVFRGHAAMIEAHLDVDIGMFLDRLEADEALNSNTLVVFTSDNGAQWDSIGYNYRFFESTGGLRGYKRTMYEGGLRVPTLIRWKGVLPAGVVSNVPFALYDLAATFYDIAGLPPRPSLIQIEDRMLPTGARSMWPTWNSTNASTGQSSHLPARDWLHMERCYSQKKKMVCLSATYNISQWMNGKVWKLVVKPDNSSELFELGADPTEKKALRIRSLTESTMKQSLMQLRSDIRSEPANVVNV